MNIYQVFPRLFGNANSTNKPNGTKEENGCGKLNDFTQPILEQIKNQGYTHIWYTGLLHHATKTDYLSFGITPDHPGIVKGEAGSPYAIKDYYDIDPDLADNINKRMIEFEELVERTHQADLKAIIDFVPNHVARSYKSQAKSQVIKDLGCDDNTDWEFSPQNNFYYLYHQPLMPQFDMKGYIEFPAKATGNDQFTASPQITDWYETVKLNYGVDYVGGMHKHFSPTPNTWIKMRDILLFWSSKNVDGFRCDMAEMVPVEFWAWAIPQIKEKYPHIIFIAEVYNPAEYRNYIFQGKFDYLYDKVGMYDTLKGVICGYRPASALTGCWQAVDDIKKHMLNFLENHDEQRIASDFFAKEPEKAIPALIFLATFSSAPLMIYCGQEFGEPGMDSEGFSGKDGRTTIFDYWSVDTIRKWYNKGKSSIKKLPKEIQKLHAVYTKLLQLRNEEKALSEGVFYDLMWQNHDNPNFNSEKQFAFFRQFEKELLFIAVNFDDKPIEISVNIPAHAFEFLNIPLSKNAECTDLLSDNAFIQELSATKPFSVKLEKQFGVILKIK